VSIREELEQSKRELLDAVKREALRLGLRADEATDDLIHEAERRVGATLQHGKRRVIQAIGAALLRRMQPDEPEDEA